MLIDDQYFTNTQTRIAGIDTRSDGEPAGNAPQLIADIMGYIERYEPIFLKMLLGWNWQSIIKDFPELLPLLRQPDKGTSVIAKYVYFLYERDHITFNTVAGEKLKRDANSTSVSQNGRLVRIWNDMVDENLEIIAEIQRMEYASILIRPNLTADIFYKINVFNL